MSCFYSQIHPSYDKAAENYFSRSIETWANSRDPEYRVFNCEHEYQLCSGLQFTIWNRNTKVPEEVREYRVSNVSVNPPDWLKFRISPRRSPCIDGSLLPDHIIIKIKN